MHQWVACMCVLKSIVYLRTNHLLLEPVEKVNGNEADWLMTCKIVSAQGCLACHRL